MDFGYRDTASLGDRVWRDVNANGLQDDGATGLAGVTVELLNSGGTVIATTTTGTDGIYGFSNLAAGTYTVRVVSATLPAGVAPTFDLDGIGTAHTAAATLTAGQARNDVDFGYRNTASLGDRVWNDVNGNGAQDDGATGLVGVTVELLNSGGTVIATTVTGADGIYSFNNLAAGTYTVRVVSATLPAGFAPTFDLDGIASAHTAAATVTAGQTRTDVDFGYRAVATCTDGYVKDDFTTASFSNNNGTLSWAGPWIESDVAGTGVGTGNVTVGTPYAGYLILRDSPDTGTQPSAEREVNLSAFTSAKLQFTFHTTSGVDRDDAVTVEVSNNGGATYTVLETINGILGATTESRTYNITAFIASNTRIRFRVTNTYGVSDEFFKVDQVRIDGSCSPALASIGDRVWEDLDGDTIQDAGEYGLAGVQVQLLNSGGTVIATQTTLANGIYTFLNLAAGSYTVRVVSSTLPGGYVQTYDLDGLATAHAAAVTLAAGQSRTEVDFGYRKPPLCKSETFLDTFTKQSFANDEGTAKWSGDWIESDVAGSGPTAGNVTVGTPYAGYLILRDSPDTGTQPSAAREVNLIDFPYATLQLTFHTTGGVDADDAVVIEVSRDGGATYTTLETITGITGATTASRTYDITAYIATNTRIRFRVSNNYGASDELFKVDQVLIDGTCKPADNASIGDFVWSDDNANGVHDAGELGLDKVTVELLDSGGTVIATTYTDKGFYAFTGLAAGSYTVRIDASTLPAGSTPTYDLDGVATAHTAAVTLTTGQTRTDVDFGYSPPPPCKAEYVQDNFTTASFSNNNGSMSWNGSWIEYDVAGTGVGSGNVTVGTPTSGFMALRDNPDTGTQPSAAREVNLTDYPVATLQVTFKTSSGVDAADAAVIEISGDGGASYTVLETVTGITGTVTLTRNYSITSYIAGNTRVRFRISSGYGSSSEFFRVDKVRIDGLCK